MAAASTLSAIAPGGCLPSKEIIWLSVYRDLVQAASGGSDLRRREVRKQRAPDLGVHQRTSRVATRQGCDAQSGAMKADMHWGGGTRRTFVSTECEWTDF